MILRLTAAPAPALAPITRGDGLLRLCDSAAEPCDALWDPMSNDGATTDDADVPDK